MFKRIVHELRHHAPFTIFGAVLGVVFIFLFRNVSAGISYKVFYVLHPLHVLLSAQVTAGIYMIYKCEGDKGKYNFLHIFLIGYLGSVGVATVSDSLIPYLGEFLLDMPNREAHIGFIEEWWIVNPLAIIGILFAYFKPMTKFPHAGHVLVSTWASLFHILMAVGAGLVLSDYIAILLFLFVAVWIPCCVSDIVFPLLFVKDIKKVPTCCCH